VSAEHTRLVQLRPRLLISSLREKYWIPGIRNLVKTVIHHCVTCYKLKARATQQFMFELPSTRVQTSRPFLNTEVDYARPVSLRVRSPFSKTTIKGHITNCLLCHQGNLHWSSHQFDYWSISCCPEMLHSTLRKTKDHSFWQWYQLPRSRKMNSIPSTRCCRPHQMATIQDFLAAEGCMWNFIPPHAPHFGGLWEAAVKSMKYYLRRMLGAHFATCEELCTMLSEIEACLNSRSPCA